MSIKLVNIKHINARFHSTVNGYLRMISHKNKSEQPHETSNTIIPQLVSQMCLLFYYQSEYFAFVADNEHKTGSPGCILTNDNKTAYTTATGAASIFGNIEIGSLSQTICEWKLRINVKQGFENWTIHHLLLGITGDPIPDKMQYVQFEREECSLVWMTGREAYMNTYFVRNVEAGYHNVWGRNECVVSKRRREEKILFRKDDVVGIKLDLLQRNIEYFINDKSVGIVFKDIPIDESIKYRLFITIFMTGHGVTLESHKYL